jgi:Tol biopolymer transport system component
MSMTSYRPGVVVALAAAAASLLALVFAAQPAGAAFSSKNGEITFVRGTRAAQATDEVYVMGPDGSEQTRLTNNAVFDGLPAFSPDGQRIAFTSRRNSQGSAVNDEIFVMSPRDEDGDGNGDGLAQITSTSTENEFQPAFSPEGDRIAFTSSQNGNEIFVMDADGTDRVRLTNNAARDARPAFSPRGDRIAFTSNRPGPDGFTDDEIYVMDAADTDGDGNGDNLTQITDNTTVPVNDIPVLVNDTHANFSPDGEEVAFTSNRDSTALQQNDEIYLSNSDGSGTPTRLTNNPAVDEFPAFSPDGEELAFSSERDGNVDIYTMEVAPEGATGNQPLRLTDSTEIDSKPDWGPSLYDFGGFYEPVDNLPTTNGVKAGSAVPVKFDLGGDQGLDVLAAENPASRRIDCDSAAPIDNIEQTTTAGESGLSYDTETGRYVYVWKTDKAWSGTCRQFVMRLDDGTVHRADFEFK